MQMNRSPLPNTVGFDRLLRMLDDVAGNVGQATGFPSYNLEKLDDDHYRITLAVAGFAREDLDIQVSGNDLTLSGKKADNGSEEDEKVEVLHHGIAQRSFSRRFVLADHVKVTGAELTNGLLTVDLARELPEAAKPRRIDIN